VTSDNLRVAAVEWDGWRDSDRCARGGLRSRRCWVALA
jgi:hypothetical protein